MNKLRKLYDTVFTKPNNAYNNVRPHSLRFLIFLAVVVLLAFMPAGNTQILVGLAIIAYRHQVLSHFITSH